jgi:hypothetical protein
MEKNTENRTRAQSRFLVLAETMAAVLVVRATEPIRIEKDCKVLMRRKLMNMGVMWHDQ